MAYKSSWEALSDTIKIWNVISQFTNDTFEELKSRSEFNHIAPEVIKREAVKLLNMDEGIINLCPLCDYYECSQRCLLSDFSFSSTCNFGCTKRCCCVDFQESLIEKDWNRARECAREFADELRAISSTEKSFHRNKSVISH